MLLDMHWTGKVDSVAFTIFGRDIAWYGIIITLAMVTGLIVAMKRGKKVGLTSDDFLEIFMFAIPLAILFARLGYVMVRPDVYFNIPNFGWNDFVNVIAVWDGGLTIMTGVPGGILGGFLWSKWRKVDFITAADIIIPVVLLSQGLGRWGNFCNQEIYGGLITNTNLQWFPMAVYIANKGAFYQATFFYEMVMDIAAFFILISVQKRLKVRGAGLLGYLSSYCFIRFVMEFFRDDGNIYEKINYNQIICGIIAVAAFAALIAIIVIKIKKGERVWYAKGLPQELLPVAHKRTASETADSVNGGDSVNKTVKPGFNKSKKKNRKR